MYKVPFVGYIKQYKDHKKEFDKAYSSCDERGAYIFQKELQDFEDKLAKMNDSKYGIGTDSCTGALHIALWARGIGPGDEVITVSHTFVATIDVICRLGATPVLIDVKETDHNMDESLIEKVITKRTKAIIPVHLNGRMCNMEKIMKIAKKYNLFVVEDSAQAAGAKFKGKGHYGDVSCYSFYPAKVLGSQGEGGMAITTDKELAKKLYLLRDHGLYPGYVQRMFDIKADPKDIHCIGGNSILDNKDAAFLLIKLKHFDKAIKRRREIANRYNKELSRLKEIVCPPAPSNGDYYDVYQNYVIRVKDGKRDKLNDYLNKSGVETIVSWRIPNHKQKALTELHKFKLPITEKISNEVISLPMYPELANKQIDYVIKIIQNFYKKK